MADPLSTKGDQARAEILEAARRLFVSQGYHGTSMRAIAREAGDRAVAGLYNHFPTKEAIFKALIEERNPYDDLFAALDSALEDARTAPDFIRAALHSALEIMPRHYDFIQLAQIDLREFGGQTIGAVLESAVLPRALGLIQQVQGLPGLKPIDGLVWLRMLASLVIGFMVTEPIAPFTGFHRYSHAEWADQFAAVLIHGVGDPGATY
jgi:AcrR family transcriptional regulator